MLHAVEILSNRVAPCPLAEPAPTPMSGNFVELPSENEILERLRAIGGGSRARDLVFQKLARRLDARTLDNAAFSFLLMEMLHRFEWALGEEVGQFLPKCILALTGDSDLATSARTALTI